MNNICRTDFFRAAVIFYTVVFVTIIFATTRTSFGQGNVDRKESQTVSKERMVQTVRFLSEENFPRTATPARKERTIAYLMKALEESGAEAVRSDFVIRQILGDPPPPTGSPPAGFLSASSLSADAPAPPVSIELARYTLTNIHAVKQGKTRKRIVVAAHYDAIVESPGADDNASGAAALIELAYLLYTDKGEAGKEEASEELNCDVELVFYDEEERGLLGSRYHARKLKNEGVDVVCMLCLDLVGYYSDEENSQTYPMPGMRRLYGSKGDFLALLGRPAERELITRAHKAFQENTSLRMLSLSAPPGLDMVVSRSDHAPFWQEGYSALFFTDTADFRNRHYHKPTDTWDTLDYDRLVQVPVGIYHVIKAIDVWAVDVRQVAR